MSDDDEALRATLVTFIKDRLGEDISDDDALDAVIGLVENGLIRIWHDTDNKKIEIQGIKVII